MLVTTCVSLLQTRTRTRTHIHIHAHTQKANAANLNLKKVRMSTCVRLRNKCRILGPYRTETPLLTGLDVQTNAMVLPDRRTSPGHLLGSRLLLPAPATAKGAFTGCVCVDGIDPARDSSKLHHLGGGRRGV